MELIDNNNKPYNNNVEKDNDSNNGYKHSRNPSSLQNF